MPTGSGLDTAIEEFDSSNEWNLLNERELREEEEFYQDMILGGIYDDVDTKVWIMINHVKKIKTYAGYSGYTPDKKPSWI